MYGVCKRATARWFLFAGQGEKVLCTPYFFSGGFLLDLAFVACVPLTKTRSKTAAVSGENSGSRQIARPAVGAADFGESGLHVVVICPEAAPQMKAAVRQRDRWRRLERALVRRGSPEPVRL